MVYELEAVGFGAKYRKNVMAFNQLLQVVNLSSGVKWPVSIFSYNLLYYYEFFLYYSIYQPFNILFYSCNLFYYVDFLFNCRIKQTDPENPF